MWCGIECLSIECPKLATSVSRVTNQIASLLLFFTLWLVQRIGATTQPVIQNWARSQRVSFVLIGSWDYFCVSFFKLYRKALLHYNWKLKLVDWERENARYRGVIGFSCISYWLRGWSGLWHQKVKQSPYNVGYFRPSIDISSSKVKEEPAKNSENLFRNWLRNGLRNGLSLRLLVETFLSSLKAFSGHNSICGAVTLFLVGQL